MLAKALAAATWTEEQDTLIATMRVAGKPLSALIELFPEKPFEAIKQRCKELRRKHQDAALGAPWTSGELKKLSKAVLLHESKNRNWNRIAEGVPGRTAEQCHQAWLAKLRTTEASKKHKADDKPKEDVKPTA